MGGGMDKWARWACEQLSFSACYALSPAEQLVYAGGFLLIAFAVGLLLVGLVLGWFTR
jgi:predicted GNAT superfamily acetyltransferase